MSKKYEIGTYPPGHTCVLGVWEFSRWNPNGVLNRGPTVTIVANYGPTGVVTYTDETGALRSTDAKAPLFEWLESPGTELARAYAKWRR